MMFTIPLCFGNIHAGSGKEETKKKRVRFTSQQQVENRDRQINEMENKKKASSSSSGGGGSRSRVMRDNHKHGQMEEGSMPGNWQALYKGILQYRKLSTPCV